MSTSACFRSRVAYAKVKEIFSSVSGGSRLERTVLTSGAAWIGVNEAAKYRLAEKAEDLSIKQELLDLAVVCEDVASNIEDRIPEG